MLRRIIRIVVPALVALSLLGGCVRLEERSSNALPQEAISFSAGSLLMLDDDVPTRAGDECELKEGDFVAEEDAIAVYGARYANGLKTVEFDGTIVSKLSVGWDYSPHKSWNWHTDGDYYDFIGAYPSAGIGTSRMEIPGNLAISTPYSLVSATPDSYDLLYAAQRRFGNESNRQRTVELAFSHMLSAVQVIVTDDSKSTALTVDSYEFQHVIASASAKVTMDAFGIPEFSWINIMRNNSIARGHYDIDAALTGKDYAGPHKYESPFSLFIPDDLSNTSDGSDNEDKMPHLILRFTPDGEAQREERILLRDVQNGDPMLGGTTPIDSWRPGVKYIYNISIRLDGGVEVTVITTEWESLEAETPGILIE